MDRLKILIKSFGFKYGKPEDCTVLMDVRFLPNPYYIDELRPLNGMDEPIKEYLRGFDESEEFISLTLKSLKLATKGFEEHDREELIIGVGCTGGRHRSVYCATRLYEELLAEGFDVRIEHVDINKDCQHD